MSNRHIIYLVPFKEKAALKQIIMSDSEKKAKELEQTFNI